MCLTVFTGICTVRTTVYSNVNVNVNNKSSTKEMSTGLCEEMGFQPSYKLSTTNG